MHIKDLVTQNMKQYVYIKWMSEWSLIPIHTDLCEHTGMLITRSYSGYSLNVCICMYITG